MVVVSGGIVVGAGHVVGGKSTSIVTGGHISVASAWIEDVVNACTAAIRVATATTAAARLPDMGQDLTERRSVWNCGPAGYVCRP